MHEVDVPFIKVKRVLETEYLFDLELEDGNVIHVRKDGSAIGNNGERFFSVSREDEDEEELSVLGWSDKISAGVVV